MLDGEAEPVAHDREAEKAPAAVVTVAAHSTEQTIAEPTAATASSEAVPEAASAGTVRHAPDTRERTGQVLRGFGIVLLGLVVGAGLAAAIAWDEVAPLLASRRSCGFSLRHKAVRASPCRHAFRGGDAPASEFHDHSPVVPSMLEQVVLRRRAAFLVALATGRDAHDWHGVGTRGAGDPRCGGKMRVAMQNQFRAMLGDHALKPADPEKALVVAGRAAHGRVDGSSPLERGPSFPSRPEIRPPWPPARARRSRLPRKARSPGRTTAR